jgi:hypothetical protein
MTQDEYNKLFHKEQLNLVAFKRLMDCDEEVLRLVNSAIKAEREAVANWFMHRGFATGHGDAIVDMLDELEWQVAEREREACAECGADGGHALYCVACAEKFIAQTETKDEPLIAFNAEVVGYVAPQRTWVGLTHAEFAEILCDDRWQGRPELMLLQAQAKLKDKNT